MSKILQTSKVNKKKYANYISLIIRLKYNIGYENYC